MASMQRCLLLVLAIAAIAMVVVNTQPAAAKQGPQKLKFYMFVAVQNNSNLNNPNATYTAVQSAQPPSPHPNSFGIIHTFDNPLTTAPSLNSTQVGRVQGWYGDVGQNVLTLFLVQTFTYADGKHNGTFSLVGVDVATDAVKYGPIVGGTGAFAFARGVAEQVLISTANITQETVSWFRFIIHFKY
eukprot:c14782_g1_i1 orf=83-640(-)